MCVHSLLSLPSVSLPIPPLKGRNQKEERIQPQSLGEGDLKHNKLI